MMKISVQDVVIVGGGLTGVATAIHLVRQAETPLRIAIVEPSEQLGRGLAYGNPEAECRLNGPSARNGIYPDNISHFHDWYVARGLDEQDPDARDVSGYYFPKRYDFGTYLDTEMRKHIAQNPSKSDIHHIVDRATDVVEKDGVFEVALDSGKTVCARVLIVAATPGMASVPSVLSSWPKDDAPFLPDPWDADRLSRIPKAANVLILGMAQTASDVAAVLLKYGHQGPITLLSRRGKRPRKRPPLPAPSDARDETPQTDLYAHFFGPDGAVKPASRILGHLRLEARAAEGHGQSWVPVMEKLRGFISDHWNALPLAEKRRFLRHGRTFYDIHRFRLPPQVESRIEKAEAAGQVRFMSASILDATSRGTGVDIVLRERGQTEATSRTFDVVVNCTGLEDRPAHTRNPFLKALLTRWYARQHATGCGFDVDDCNIAIDEKGCTKPALFIVGPLTYGAFADQQGSVFIVHRVLHIVPNILRQISGR
jgi:uncharacterized NAD(P)/FAD-binding protein YdhS